nr:DUF6498-containing protein [Thiolapillus sp.]
MQITPSRLENLFSDNSVWGLLLANLVTIVMAVMQDWSLLLVMWVYWCQSVIIGLFNFWRMMTLKRFSTKGVSSSNGPVLPTQKTKREMSWFFLIHYGMFHAGYLIFLFSGVFGEQPRYFSVGPMLMCSSSTTPGRSSATASVRRTPFPISVPSCSCPMRVFFPRT